MLLFFCLHAWQLKSCETDEEVKMTLSVDEAMDLVMATGYPKPLQILGIEDIREIVQMLLRYRLCVKVKAEMDQFTDGLKALGFLDMLREQPPLWEGYFVPSKTALSPGVLKCSQVVFNPT